jgi:poly(A) polymerase
MFFEVYSQWDWPSIPVKLYEIEDLPDNPKNPENWTGAPEDLQKGKMFVITPSFPSMNSSHMITDSSLIILKDLILKASNSLFAYEASQTL